MRLCLAVLPFVAGCMPLDPHGREDYLSLYVFREGTLEDHEKDRMLELCTIQIAEGKLRLDAENHESRWRVHAEGNCDTPDLSALAGSGLDVLIDVEFKFDDYIKPVPGRIKIFEVTDRFVKGSLEGKGRDREVRADFQALRN